jgi:hypothetical protein
MARPAPNADHCALFSPESCLVRTAVLPWTDRCLSIFSTVSGNDASFHKDLDLQQQQQQHEVYRCPYGCSHLAGVSYGVGAGVLRRGWHLRQTSAPPVRRFYGAEYARRLHVSETRAECPPLSLLSLSLLLLLAAVSHPPSALFV